MVNHSFKTNRWEFFSPLKFPFQCYWVVLPVHFCYIKRAKHPRNLVCFLVQINNVTSICLCRISQISFCQSTANTHFICQLPNTVPTRCFFHLEIINKCTGRHSIAEHLLCTQKLNTRAVDILECMQTCSIEKLTSWKFNCL